MPFEQAQIEEILAAADGFNTKGKFGGMNRDGVRAMILLLRYSGLRISDAAVLERRRLSGDKLSLYTQTTGTPVKRSEDLGTDVRDRVREGSYSLTDGSVPLAWPA